MGRLIDADVALQRFIKETETSGKNVIHINTIKRLLQDIDTAYDLDKVVEELEEVKEKARTKNMTVSSYACGMMNRVIYLVKRGGRDE